VNISLLGVPIDLGADRRGVDMGPSAIRIAQLKERLERLGHEVRDEGDVEVRRPPDYGEYGPSLKYLKEIARVCKTVRRRVADIMAEGRFPLVLGGDHSLAIGSIAGVLAHNPRLGVIWFDAHGDLNRAETSPTGNIHGMSLAAALGVGHPLLVSIAGGRRRADPSRTAIVGARSLDPGEKELIRELGIRAFTMHDIDRLGMGRVMEEAIAVASDGTDGIHLSLDLDGLDPEHAPGVGTPVVGGMTYREGHLAMEMLHETGRVVSADVVEVNPILDAMNKTGKAAVGLVASLLGEKIL